MIPISNTNYFRFSGRILNMDGFPVLGFTNSALEFFVRPNGNSEITAHIGTNICEEVDEARLKVFIDDSDTASNLLVLTHNKEEYKLAEINDKSVHKITLMKITEASKSYAQVKSVHVKNGELLPYIEKEDHRLKAEFIGDSITCGFGVYGAPNAKYHIKDEDGTKSYAYFTAKALNLNARYFCVSGFGIYIQWDGDLEGNIPKVYPYTNYFFNKTEKYNFKEFVPDVFVINLGTNDSGHLHKAEVQKGFVSNYVGLIKFLKSYAPDSKILCVCGTLCTNAFEYVEKSVNLAKSEGLSGLYTMEFPYHDVIHDGIAAGHPSIATHKKNADQLTAKLKEIL